MIEPAVRDGQLRAALADQGVGVILLDVILGGAHADPAGEIVRRRRAAVERAAVVAR